MSFEIHMGGMSRPVSLLSFTKDDRQPVIEFDNKIIIGNGEISFAKVDNHFYIMIADGMHNTAILCDETGYGIHACSIDSREGYGTLNSFSKLLEGKAEICIRAISINELDTSDTVKEELKNTLAREWLSMSKKRSIHGYVPMMDVSEADYIITRDSYRNIIG